MTDNLDDKYEDLLFNDLDIRNKNEIKTYIKNSFLVRLNFLTDAKKMLMIKHQQNL